MSIRICTYNILNPFHAVKWSTGAGLNQKGIKCSKTALRKAAFHDDPKTWQQYSNWTDRVDAIIANIERGDIICLQEISPETVHDLEGRMGNHRLAIASYHSCSRKVEKHGNAIIYNPQKVEIVRTASIAFQSGKNRRKAASAVFQTEDLLFKVLSVHLRGYDADQPDPAKKLQSKKSGYKELVAYCERAEKHCHGLDGLVIAGDFNEDEEEEEKELYRLGYLLDHGYRIDGNRAITDISSGKKIDWIVYKPLSSKGDIELLAIDLEGGQILASDHYLTGTVLKT